MIEVAVTPSPPGNAVLAIDRVAAALKLDARFATVTLSRPHPLLVEVSRTARIPDEASNASNSGVPDGRPPAGEYRTCVVFAASSAFDVVKEALLQYADGVSAESALIVVVGRLRAEWLPQGVSDRIGAVVDEGAGPAEVCLAAERGFQLLEARAGAAASGRALRRHRYELGELIHIARAMTTVRDVDKLLGVILEKSRFITGADAGSIYIVERRGDSENAPILRFKLTQNDSVPFDSREFTMPLSERSIAGSAALRESALNIPDAYALPAGSTFHFDPSFDRRTGYITRSMLAVRLTSQRDEVIGVIQLINKKRDPASRLLTRADVDDQVVAFDERSEELLGMLSAQAGVSLETAMLYDEIRRLFDGFVGASVEAIESRDPTTSGHSRRVADLTIALAKIVDSETSGPYAATSFTADDLRELEYASVLHDFGKIGVRERVLVKGKKLYAERLELVRARFDYVARSIEAEVLARKLRLVELGAPPEEIAALDGDLASRLAELDAAWRAIFSANEPTVMKSGDFERIADIARETFVDLRGEVHTLLDDEELSCLSVSRGSLTPDEFDEIRSHVSHTFKFLSRIPWGKSLRRVPLIAAAHHERVDGTGYPNRLRAQEIPVQSKIMSIADIFDALTASDRPYKKAIPLDRALDILDHDVKGGHLDAHLVHLFKEARVWSRIGESGRGP